MSIPGYCDTCDHPSREHGDRAIGGSCDHEMYPRSCTCTGYRNESENAENRNLLTGNLPERGTNGPALGAA